MNEELEREINQWEKDFKKEEQLILKKYPLSLNTLSNNHPINIFYKEYMKKKLEIIKKYSTQK